MLRVRRQGSSSELGEVEFDGTVADLETLQLQVLSVTEVPPEEQHLCWNGTPLKCDEDVAGVDPSRCDVLELSAEDEERPKNADEGEQDALQTLATLFPNLQEKTREHALGMCNGNLEMACSLLMEEGPSLDAQLRALVEEPADGFDSQQKRMHFLVRLQTYTEQVKRYEEPELQAQAREAIPTESIVQRAQEAHERALAEGQEGYPSQQEYQVRELLRWFKHDFFSWVNEPPCGACGAGGSELLGAVQPSPEDQRYGAGTVEMYRCRSCQHFTRFPRYNHAGKLLETKRGRCGEWAQAFTLCCRAMGWKSRFVVDFTDHVWTEVFCEGLGRWVHCDPCDEDLVDVTRRYTKRLDLVMERRREVSEEFCEQCLERVSQALMANLPQEQARSVQERRLAEQGEMEESIRREELKEEERRSRISGNE